MRSTKATVTGDTVTRTFSSGTALSVPGTMDTSTTTEALWPRSSR
jgi:hypothetical protein